MPKKNKHRQKKDNKQIVLIDNEEHSSSDNKTSLPIVEEVLHIASELDGGRHFRLFDNTITVAVQLAQHAVFGEEEQAEALISECPELLLYRAKVVDYSGRTIIGTAFQIALGAEDVRMCKMMLPYFKSLEEGEALRQFNEQFPYGLKSEDELNAENVYDLQI